MSTEKPKPKKTGLYVHMPPPVLRHLKKKLRNALDGDYVTADGDEVRIGLLQSAVLLHFASLDLDDQKPIIEAGLAEYRRLAAGQGAEKALPPLGPPGVHDAAVEEPPARSRRAPRGRGRAGG